MEVGWGFTGQPHTYTENLWPRVMTTKKPKDTKAPGERAFDCCPRFRNSTVPGSLKSLSPALVSGSEA